MKILLTIYNWLLGFGAGITAFGIIILVIVILAVITVLGYLLVIFTYIIIPVLIIIGVIVALARFIYKYFRS